ncbi:MAG: PorT family protein [Prevotellaceae bacterium]|jgi:hypothetical protein|nr:PorT family protein [Prevotellaceae bacterium]
MKKIIALLLIILAAQAVYGQSGENTAKEKTYTLEHKIVAGFNFGATAPMPIPEEVRKVEAWWPQFGAQLGYNILMRGTGNWGIGSGIMLDYKGMGVRDKVKYMHTIVDINTDDNQGKFEGYFTGRNQTIVKNSYVTIPVYLTYYLKEKWRFRLGGYASYLFSSEFSGKVWDGYIRVDDYTGEKILIPEYQPAFFNFGDKLRSFDFGVIGGSEYKLNYRFGIFTNISYGITSIFQSSFKGVGFKMHNLYATIGMTYTL